MQLKRSGRGQDLHRTISLFFLFLTLITSVGSAQGQNPVVNSTDDLIRKTYFVSSQLQERIQGASYKGILVRQDERQYGEKSFSVVTNFNQDTYQTVELDGVNQWADAARVIDNHYRTYDMGKIPIQELTLKLPNGAALIQYWVGNRAFSTLDEAANSIRQLKTDSGANYHELAERFNVISLEGDQLAEKISEKMKKEVPQPLYKKHEKRVPKNWAERIEAYLGDDDFVPRLSKDTKFEKYFGPRASGGSLYEFQNFGNAKYLNTAFDRPGFNITLVSYTSRLSIRGLKVFDSSIDPFIEATVNLEGSARDFQNTIIPVAGLEYRPWRRNVTLSNSDWFRWVRNIRFYVEYEERKNLQGNIPNSSNNDFRFGADVFYRWGFDLPDPGQKDTPWLAQLFAKADWENTNFSGIPHNYNWVLANETIIGWKLPPIPVPENPFIENIQLIPHYMVNIEWSSPGVFYQNRILNNFGVMWFPFRSEKYRHVPQLQPIFLYWRWRWYTDALEDPRPEANPKYDWEMGIDFTVKRF